MSQHALVSQRWTRSSAWLLVTAAIALTGGQDVHAQSLSYSSGQNISPGYEGWEEDPDGSRWFVFGYMNRNWEEEPEIPVGPENSIEPGGPDLGQPTHFLPRRNRFVFRVPVPNGFAEDDEMVWVLTVNGVTERAYATLRPDYYMDAMVRASENGAIGAGTTDPEIRANQGPTLKVVGTEHRTVRVGATLTLVVSATDDGIPPSPRRELLAFLPNALNPWVPHWRPTVNSETGLRVSWFLYRGRGDVMFDPPQTKVWEDTRTGANSPWAPHWVTPDLPEDGQFVTQVTFDQPGRYTLRCLASDGALNIESDVTVEVTE